MPWKSKTTKTKKPEVSNQFMLSAKKLFDNCLQKLSENGPAVVSATKETTSEKDQVIETNSKAVRWYWYMSYQTLWRAPEFQKLAEKPQDVVPTTINYITATGKQALLLLQSAGALIPVPMIQDAIGVALKIIDICEVRKIPERLQDGS